jgi:mono/diheme cytochrome c family protein
VFLGPASDASTDSASADAKVAEVSPPPTIVLPADFLALPAAQVELSGLPVYDPTLIQRFSQVRSAPRATPPIGGGTLALSASGRVVISDPDRDQLYIVDAAFERAVTLPLASGQEPGRIATSGERAYVALRAGGKLLTLDLTVPSVTTSVAVCAAPRGVFFDAAAQRVLVACAGGDLVSVSPDGARVTSKLYLAPDLRDVGRDAQGLWVTRFSSADLLRLDTNLHELSRRRPADTSVQTTTNMLKEFQPNLAWRTLTAPSGDVVMLHQRAQTSPIDLANQLASSGAGGLPGGASPGVGSVSSGNPYGGGNLPSGPGSFCEGGIVHTTVSQFGVGLPAPQRALPQAVVPSDLSLSPDGRLLALVAPGNFVQDGPFEIGGAAVRQLFVTSAAALARPAPAFARLQDQDDCVRDAPRAEHRFPGEATALLFADARTLLVQVRNPAELHVLRFDDNDAPRLRSVLALSPIALGDTGHEVFHQNTGTGIACASCHGEGLDDGHVWNFGSAGLRRTQHLRGGVLARAPFHWTADLPGLSALINDVYQQRMGAAPLGEDARLALGVWLNALPLVPAEPGEPGAVARGRVLFEASEVGCSSCHAGSDLRSSQTYDVGTGGQFKVPSLRGAALRLPLMHTGCADTLKARFDPACGGDKHGSTAQLAPAQIDDLVAYLGSL